MSAILDWIKEHVRPYVSLPDREGDFPVVNEKPEESVGNKVEDVVKDAEVGIRIKWRF